MASSDRAKSKSLKILLRDEIAKIQIYSGHEHFCSEEDYLARRLDFSDLFNYLGLVLSEAGLPGDQRALLQSQDVSEEDKWDIFEPFMASIRKKNELA